MAIIEKETRRLVQSKVCLPQSFIFLLHPRISFGSEIENCTKHSHIVVSAFYDTNKVGIAMIITCSVVIYNVLCIRLISAIYNRWRIALFPNPHLPSVN